MSDCEWQPVTTGWRLSLIACNRIKPHLIANNNVRSNSNWTSVKMDSKAQCVEVFVNKQVSRGEIISFCVRVTLVLVRVGVSNTFICVSAASLRVVRCEHTHTCFGYLGGLGIHQKNYSHLLLRDTSSGSSSSGGSSSNWNCTHGYAWRLLVLKVVVMPLVRTHKYVARIPQFYFWYTK